VNDNVYGRVNFVFLISSENLTERTLIDTNLLDYKILYLQAQVIDTGNFIFQNAINQEMLQNKYRLA
jgi:hypothetical protein